MEEFVTRGNRAIFLPPIARQAAELKCVLIELRDRYKERFAYLRVYPLEGADRLNHKLYPDLYYAAVSAAIRNNKLGPEGRYVMTNVQTTIPKHMIEKQTKEDPLLRVQPFHPGIQRKN